MFSNTTNQHIQIISIMQTEYFSLRIDCFAEIVQMLNIFQSIFQPI